MKVFNKNEWLHGSKAAVFKVKRTLILNNVNKEFYHEDINKAQRMVSVTRDLETNEMTITVNIDKFKKIIL